MRGQQPHVRGGLRGQFRDPPVAGDGVLDCPDPAVHRPVHRVVHVHVDRGLGDVQQLLLVILLLTATA